MQVVDRVSTLTSFVMGMSIGSLSVNLRDSVVKGIACINYPLQWAWAAKNLDNKQDSDGQKYKGGLQIHVAKQLQVSR